MAEKTHKHQLNPVRLGKAMGILWAVAMLIYGLCDLFILKGSLLSSIMSQWYMGYNPTPLGLILGVVWGFIDGFIGGYILAWVYNKV
ncbi:hypothetical protein A3A93_05350 [Candidatus Roizmanbacteria bacterium RIFCSPLOWO2_01_FULL_38_12]|uniref:Membrane-associated protein n=1 Tax=Candidatus Roizmanbacteria bacterium RIFCSPLOWO2_01_FULL_38_12 TaxID=1802061 RepID=A0A1F7IZ24_9BACT|nr:MAG: hypothetical protein A2861_03565 [Candidatus Roizmanbacteria bacterium RIFCSPHIGHO2_01_FULL_38_15]OGK35648.1 MAG: hypothetical protein A3F59_01780 [Candidatus Roizmanbacteria bacterium RIFCSPHIGHO2_12_FULL_38_13]OGK48614.1 MAG: hypothetical protein A3A93_05350 [Candidatus Roizmanbacteria bacterium RIFCSPLOWO2_01_FULL_38_12]